MDRLNVGTPMAVSRSPTLLFRQGFAPDPSTKLIVTMKIMRFACSSP
ncbi:hypothetical protein V6H11_002271 [Burkholderia multivorans]|nr:hypothetical protein [Burkholderia multivorans]EJO55073.1 hypothetical protein BURMUCF1_A2233 [Burkholderia multivorans ATCC BAA-247]MCL4626890.1 hypothetical protein [Burkholderia multivorans]MCO1391618.1 hypothetical protein [Burkholderia multivorans]MCO1437877.1 hypothetical protein [Burkholderia multivorans]MDN7433566.1 hypothetical protein [Burkholderia multivorans]